MKVCTDACLFGAWTTSNIIIKELPSSNILDIGAGTGLLSLMLAQQLKKSIIRAVEVDTAAVRQASENFAASPWRDQLKVFNTSIQSFSPAQQYDFIITNPPFFQNNLASPNAQRNVALHGHQLSLEELVAAIQMHLSAKGHFAVLLPYHRTPLFETLALSVGFYLHQKTLVQQTSTHSFFRSMLLFGREQKTCEQMTIIIKDVRGDYTDAFVSLLKDYYLYL